MSWAAGRRLVILLVIGAFVVASATVLWASVFYKAPSCSDNTQNQGEAGVDCGGPCAYRCTEQEQAPTVLFTKALGNGAGRTDAVAEVENKNPDAAAKDVPYKLTLYGADQTVANEVTGTLDLPPNTITPVFVPGVASGSSTITGAFLEINPASFRWLSMPSDPRILPEVSTPQLEGNASAPRIEAVLQNFGTLPMNDVRVVAFVYDSRGIIIAASGTLITRIPAQGKATALFTWSSAFPATPARIEVVPVIPLP